MLHLPGNLNYSPLLKKVNYLPLGKKFHSLMNLKNKVKIFISSNPMLNYFLQIIVFASTNHCQFLVLMNWKTGNSAIFQDKSSSKRFAHDDLRHQKVSTYLFTFCVQRRSSFIQKQDFRISYNGASNCNALFFPSRQLRSMGPNISFIFLEKVWRS